MNESINQWVEILVRWLKLFILFFPPDHFFRAHREPRISFVYPFSTRINEFNSPQSNTWTPQSTRNFQVKICVVITGCTWKDSWQSCIHKQYKPTNFWSDFNIMQYCGCRMLKWGGTYRWSTTAKSQSLKARWVCKAGAQQVNLWKRIQSTMKKTDLNRMAESSHHPLVLWYSHEKFLVKKFQTESTGSRVAIAEFKSFPSFARKVTT